PRASSNTREVQTLTPDRRSQLWAAHVSWPISPGRGTEWNVHTSLPLRTSQALTSPAAPSVGISWTRDPVITRSRYTMGGELIPNGALGMSSPPIVYRDQ